MTEKNGAQAPNDHNQSKLMKFIMSEEAASVQTLIDGDEEGQTVMESDYVIEYEVFTLKGIEAKINTDLFDSMPERLAKMQDEEDDNGKKKYTKDDIKKFIRAWCFNKCKALPTNLATREDFMEMAGFIEAMIFDGDEELRNSPPKNIKKSKAVSTYKVWETKKFKIKVATSAFVNIENRVKKLRKKGLKKDIFNLEAETEKVVFLQNHMSLKSGEYCSGPEFAAYYKELYNEMFPADFGKPDKDDDKAEKKKEKHPDQTDLTEEKPKKKKTTSK